MPTYLQVAHKELLEISTLLFLPWHVNRWQQMKIKEIVFETSKT